MLKPGQTRFLLASLVILYHLSQSIFFGQFAVGCFFVLSGYWIALMYEAKYSKKKDSVRIFYASRLWRLLPVFYVFTILGFLSYLIFRPDFHNIIHGLPLDNKIKMYIADICLLGYANNKFNLLVPAWSLDIEMQFYIVFPLIAFLIKKYKASILYLTILFTAVAILLFVLNQVVLMHTLLYYLYLFLIGVLIREYRLKPGKMAKNWSLITLSVIIAAQFLVPSLRGYVKDQHAHYFTILNFVMILTAVPAVISSVFIETNKNDKFWGEMSFIVYLAHWVWLIPYNVLIAHGGKLERIPYVIGFLLITFLSAYLVYKFIDRPFERLRHQWINRQG